MNQNELFAYIDGAIKETLDYDKFLENTADIGIVEQDRLSFFNKGYRAALQTLKGIMINFQPENK